MDLTVPALNSRPAEASDLEEIVSFPQNTEELFFCYPKAVWPFSVEQLSAAIAERRDSTLVLLNERIAGFANFYQVQHGEFCALGNLMVAPWARGHGVAQYLVEVMEQLARINHAAGLMKVSCFNTNTAGLLLYPKLGYQACGIAERHDPAGRRVALIQFEKELAQPV